MPGVGPAELLVVLVIALVVLGPRRLPEAGRSLGRGLREFKQGIAETGPALREELEGEPAEEHDGAR
ncbi:MAG TPA: twin-arginine translocase TatA/TatE family subunit [Baekduia sp.]|uniref:twin-arginine translocase TatA/TatE family subunit n=1 Tax=Baekduia sp. TaxID=2600305 RepID=UPI002D78F0A6|nr:twin-arginine translocase TatA/TatE family subunit [Baekduia sp.]HET6508001.1 twin-arginine translocase TatA/TatE family subunit [Baekduia sp.]